MGVIENAKELVSLVRKFDNIELERKIVDVQGDLILLVQENHVLQGKVRELREQLELRENLVAGVNVYWCKTDESERDGPFCTACLDSKGKLVRLRSHSDEDWFCPVCRDFAAKQSGSEGRQRP